MAFDVAKAIEALGKATEKGFSFAEEAKERQAETEIIKDWKKLQKAVNCAEKLIVLMFPCFTPMDEQEEKKFKKLLKTFLENN